MLTLKEVAEHWQLRPAAVRARDQGWRASCREDCWPLSDELAGRLGLRVRGAPGGVLADRYRAPLLTKADLAQAMRVSVRTVERWMHDGLPTRSVGSNARINRAEAVSWLRARFGIDVGDLLDVARPAAA